MDNFFDYIIIFIIIISLLNSIFGKKKKQEQKKTEGKAEPASQKRKQDAVDVLEQMFGIPSQKKEPEYYGEADENQKSWDPESEFSDADSKPVATTPAKAPSKYEKFQSAEFTPLVHKKDYSLNTENIKVVTKNRRREEIIKKLRNPKSIRDYVLVSEILGKPKALND